MLRLVSLCVVFCFKQWQLTGTIDMLMCDAILIVQAQHGQQDTTVNKLNGITLKWVHGSMEQRWICFNMYIMSNVAMALLVEPVAARQSRSLLLHFFLKWCNALHYVCNKTELHVSLGRCAGRTRLVLMVFSGERCEWNWAPRELCSRQAL